MSVLHVTSDRVDHGDGTQVHPSLIARPKHRRDVVMFIRSAVRTAIRLGRSARERMVGWHVRYVTIRELSALDDKTLADIGLRRSEIHWVADKLSKGNLRSPQTLRQERSEEVPSSSKGTPETVV